METRTIRTTRTISTTRTCWLCELLISWLCFVSCVGSSPLSSVVRTTSGVGLQAVLPCTCGTHAKFSSQPPSIHWETVTDRVFERTGERSFQGEAYRDRVDVPKRLLEEGNCSLLFTDVQFSDAGIYESYLVVGESRIKKRIFLQSVQLLVFDHKIMKWVERGEDLTLDLFTGQAETLVFKSTNSSEWTILWRRGRGTESASRLKELEDKLVLRGVRTSDSGTYKVVDADGLALSTVKVSVSDPAPATETLERQIAFGRGTGNSPSLLVPVSLLLSSLVLYLL